MPEIPFFTGDSESQFALVRRKERKGCFWSFVFVLVMMLIGYLIGRYL